MFGNIVYNQSLAPERNPKRRNPKPELTQINIRTQNPYIQNRLKKINTKKTRKITRNPNSRSCL